MSTMVEKCESLLGKRCVNWNHEGQWLIPGSTRNILNSGAMCPHNGNLTKLERMSLLSEWHTYWAHEKVYLVEKSPHSFLKIPLLRELFSSAISIRFVVLLKHPVTLNIATPKGFSWTQRAEKAASAPSIRIDQQQQQQHAKDSQKPLSLSQKYQVAQFFLDLMQHDNSTIYNHRKCVILLLMSIRDPRCSMGWLPAMHAFHSQLLADPRSNEDVRIVRFESFQSPLLVCQTLFQFVLHHSKLAIEFQMQRNASIEKLCVKHFKTSKNPNSAVASSSHERIYMYSAHHQRSASKPFLLLPGQTGRSSRTIKAVTSPSSKAANMGKSKSKSKFNTTKLGAPVNRGLFPVPVNVAAESMHRNKSHAYDIHDASNVQRRELRLRSSQDSGSPSFSFIPELVSERGRARIRDFVAAYHTLGPAMKGKLDLLAKQLKPFGYSLFQWQATSIGESLFYRWELIV